MRAECFNEVDKNHHFRYIELPWSFDKYPDKASDENVDYIKNGIVGRYRTSWFYISGNGFSVNTPNIFLISHRTRKLGSFQYKGRFSGYGDSHVEDKTAVRPFYLLYGNPYTG